MTEAQREALKWASALLLRGLETGEVRFADGEEVEEELGRIYDALDAQLLVDNPAKPKVIQVRLSLALPAIADADEREDIHDEVYALLERAMGEIVRGQLIQDFIETVPGKDNRFEIPVACEDIITDNPRQFPHLVKLLKEQ